MGSIEKTHILKEGLRGKKIEKKKREITGGSVK